MTSIFPHPLITRAPRVIQTHDLAIANKWTPTTTHYPDPDCDLVQTFTKGPLTLAVTWAGEGTFKTILSVDLTTTEATEVKVMIGDGIFNDKNPLHLTGGQDFLEWVTEDIIRDR